MTTRTKDQIFSEARKVYTGGRGVVTPWTERLEEAVTLVSLLKESGLKRRAFAAGAKLDNCLLGRLASGRAPNGQEWPALEVRLGLRKISTAAASAVQHHECIEIRKDGSFVVLLKVGTDVWRQYLTAKLLHVEPK